MTLDGSLEKILAHLIFLEEIAEKPTVSFETLEAREDNTPLYVACGICLFIIFKLLHKRNYLSWTKKLFAMAAISKDITHLELSRRDGVIKRLVAIYGLGRSTLNSVVHHLVLVCWDRCPLKWKIQTNRENKRGSVQNSTEDALTDTLTEQETQNITDARTGNSSTIPKVDQLEVVSESQEQSSEVSAGKRSIKRESSPVPSKEKSSDAKSWKNVVKFYENVLTGKGHEEINLNDVSKEKRDLSQVSEDFTDESHQKIKFSPRLEMKESLNLSSLAQSIRKVLTQIKRPSFSKKRFSYHSESEAKLPLLLTNKATTANPGVETPKTRSIFSKTTGISRRVSPSRIHRLAGAGKVGEAMSIFQTFVPSRIKMKDKAVSAMIQKLRDKSVQFSNKITRSTGMSRNKPERDLRANKPENISNEVAKIPEIIHNIFDSVLGSHSVSHNDGDGCQSLEGMSNKKSQPLIKHSFKQTESTMSRKETEEEKKKQSFDSSSDTFVIQHEKRPRKRKSVGSTTDSFSQFPKENVKIDDTNKTIKTAAQQKIREKITKRKRGSIHAARPPDGKGNLRVNEPFASKTKVAENEGQKRQSNDYPTKKSQFESCEQDARNTKLTKVGSFKQTNAPVTEDDISKRSSRKVCLRGRNEIGNFKFPGIPENYLHPSEKETNMRRETTEFELRKIMSVKECSFCKPRYKHSSFKEGSRLPRQSLKENDVRTDSNYSPGTDQRSISEDKEKLRLGKRNRRSESIRMVESLLSVRSQNPIDKSASSDDTGASVSLAHEKHRGVLLGAKKNCTSCEIRKRIDLSLSLPEIDGHLKGFNPNISHILGTNGSQESLGKTRDTKTKLGNIRQRFPAEAVKRHKVTNMNIFKQDGGRGFREGQKMLERFGEPQICPGRELEGQDKDQFFTSEDYPIMFDQLIRQSKNNIQNTLLLCKPGETTVYKQLHLMKALSPGPVRASKTRSKTIQFPTLTSFLDHIEKEEKERNVRGEREAFQQGEMACRFKKEQVIHSDTSHRDLEASFFGNNSRHKSRTVNTEDDPTQRDPISDFTYLNLQDSSYIKTHDHTFESSVHFGTDELELYYGSLESDGIQKDDRAHITSGQDSGDTVPSKKRSFTQITDNSNPKTSSVCEKSKSLTKIPPIPQNAKKPYLRRWKKDALKTMKKVLSDKISKRDSRSIHRAKSSVGDAQKFGANREQNQKPLYKKRTRKSGLKQQCKITSDASHATSTPEATMGYDAELKQNIGSEIKLATSKRSSEIVECKMDESKRTFGSNLQKMSRPTKDYGSSSFDHTLRLTTDLETSQMLISARSSDNSENISLLVTGSHEGRARKTSKKKKINRPWSETPAESRKSVVVTLSGEIIKRSPLKSRSLSLTFNSKKRKGDKSKAPKTGDTSSKSSVSRGVNKEKREDCSKETDFSSTSKSVTFTDLMTLPRTRSTVTAPKFGQRSVGNNQPKKWIDGDSNTALFYPDVQHTKHNDAPIKYSKQSSIRHSGRSPKKSLVRRKVWKSKESVNRYLVHTAEHPNRLNASRLRKKARQMKNLSSEHGGSSTELDFSKSPTLTIPQTKPEDLQRCCPSYTSKYRANDFMGKSVKSPWRGTVAFRKRLQHLLQNNKDIQNKHNHQLSMTSQALKEKKSAPASLGSLCAERKKNLLTLLDVSKRFVDDGSLPLKTGLVKNTKTFIQHKQEQIKNVQFSTEKEKLNTQSKRLKATADKGLVSASSRATTKKAKKNVSNTESTEMQQIKVPTKVENESYKHVLTHSDIFEHKIQTKNTSEKEETRKLRRTQPTGDPTLSTTESQGKSLQDSPVVYHKNSVSSCTLINHECNAHSQLLWPLRDTKGPSERFPERDITAAVEKEKIWPPKGERIKGNARNLGISRGTDHPKSKSEQTVDENVCAKWNRNSCVSIIEHDVSEDVCVNSEVTRHNLVEKKNELLCSQDKPKGKESTKNALKTNQRLFQAENNLQQLLDKIKQSCYLSVTTQTEKDKATGSSTAEIKEKFDTSMPTTSKTSKIKNILSFKNNDRDKSSLDDSSDMTEQTRSGCMQDTKYITKATAKQYDKPTLSSVAKDVSKIVTHTKDITEPDQSIENSLYPKRSHADTNKTQKETHIKFNINSKTTTSVCGNIQSHAKINTLNLESVTNSNKPPILRIRSPVFANDSSTAKNVFATENETRTPEEIEKGPISNVKRVAFDLTYNSGQLVSTFEESIISGLNSQEATKAKSVKEQQTKVSKDDTPISENPTIQQSASDICLNKVLSGINKQVFEKDNALCDGQLRSPPFMDQNSRRLPDVEDSMDNIPKTHEFRSRFILLHATPNQQQGWTVDPELLQNHIKEAQEASASRYLKRKELGIHEGLLQSAHPSDKGLQEPPDRQPKSIAQGSSCWKKEMSMDAIPEEADSDSAMDTYSNIPSGVMNERSEAAKGDRLGSSVPMQCVEDFPIARKTLTEISSLLTTENKEVDRNQGFYGSSSISWKTDDTNMEHMVEKAKINIHVEPHICAKHPRLISLIRSPPTLYDLTQPYLLSHLNLENRLWVQFNDVTEQSPISQLKSKEPHECIEDDIRNDQTILAANSEINSSSVQNIQAENVVNEIKELPLKKDFSYHYIEHLSGTNMQDAGIRRSAPEIMLAGAGDETLPGSHIDGEKSSNINVGLDSDETNSSTSRVSAAVVPLNSNFRTNSFIPVLSLDAHNNVMQEISSIDSPITDHERRAIYFRTESEAEKGDATNTDINKGTTSPTKPAFFDVRGSAKFREVKFPANLCNAQLKKTNSSLNLQPTEEPRTRSDNSKTKNVNPIEEATTSLSFQDVQTNKIAHGANILITSITSSKPDEESALKKASSKGIEERGTAETEPAIQNNLASMTYLFSDSILGTPKIYAKEKVLPRESDLKYACSFVKRSDNLEVQPISTRELPQTTEQSLNSYSVSRVGHSLGIHSENINKRECSAIPSSPRARIGKWRTVLNEKLNDDNLLIIQEDVSIAEKYNLQPYHSTVKNETGNRNEQISLLNQEVNMENPHTVEYYQESHVTKGYAIYEPNISPVFGLSRSTVRIDSPKSFTNKASLCESVCKDPQRSPAVEDLLKSTKVEIVNISPKSKDLRGNPFMKALNQSPPLKALHQSPSSKDSLPNYQCTKDSRESSSIKFIYVSSVLEDVNLSSDKIYVRRSPIFSKRQQSPQNLQSGCKDEQRSSKDLHRSPMLKHSLLNLQSSYKSPNVQDSLKCLALRVSRGSPAAKAPYVTSFARDADRRYSSSYRSLTAKDSHGSVTAKDSRCSLIYSFKSPATKDPQPSPAASSRSLVCKDAQWSSVTSHGSPAATGSQLNLIATQRNPFGRDRHRDSTAALQSPVCKDTNLNPNASGPVERHTKRTQVISHDSSNNKISHPKTNPEAAKANNLVDDLESLLNKELKHASGNGGPKSGYESQLLFGASNDRVARRVKRKRLAAKSSSQRELQFLRENDGSLKGISSNTSQSTEFIPSEATIQQSNRPIRPLAPGRFTKLEEFLQKAEEINKSDSTLNLSRAVSKLSSFTSVTPSSQEDEQLQPLQNQNCKGRKDSSFKHCLTESNEQASLTQSKLTTNLIMPSKSLRFSRVPLPKNGQRQRGSALETQSNESGFKTVGKRSSTTVKSQSQSNCTGNNDTVGVNFAELSASNIKLAEKTEPVVSFRPQEAVKVVETDAKHEESAQALNKTGEDKQETKIPFGVFRNKNEEVISSMGVAETVGSRVLTNQPSIPECLEDTKSSSHGAILQTDESGTLSSSSSSIVLSWIGSDLVETEEMLLMTPNLIDHYEKVYSHIPAQPSTGHLSTAAKIGENVVHLTGIVPKNIEESYSRKDPLPQVAGKSKGFGTSSTYMHISVPHHKHEPELQDINVKEIKGTSLKNSQRSDVKRSFGGDFSKTFLQDESDDPRSKGLNENKITWPLPAPFQISEEFSFEGTPGKMKISHHVEFPSIPFRSPLFEINVSPDMPKSKTRQYGSGWNEHAREHTLEQPTYFNALFLDPKWNPSFDVREDKGTIDYYTDQQSSIGNYVQSAWTYQNTRNVSPVYSPQIQEEHLSPLCAHSARQHSSTTEIATTYLVSTSNRFKSSSERRSEKDNCHQDGPESPYARFNTSKTAAKNAVGIQSSIISPALCPKKQDSKQKEIFRFEAEGTEKEFSCSRKVRFCKSSGDFEKCTSNHRGLSSYVDRSLAPAREAKDVSKETNEHLKASAKSGTTSSKERLASKMPSKSIDSSRARTKVSLEQHLCSTLDAKKNVNSSTDITQPTSENGTTKSASSHASLNWYKPQSLPSSTSVNNSNTANSQEDVQRMRQTSHSHPKATTRSSQGTECTWKQNIQTVAPGPILGRNITVSSPGNSRKTNNIRHPKFVPTTHRGTLIQALTQYGIPDLERRSSEILSTYSSPSAYDVDRPQNSGIRRIRQKVPGRTSSRQTLPPSVSGNSARSNATKSARRLASTSDLSKSESKPVLATEATTTPKQNKGVGGNNGKSGRNWSNKRSLHATQSSSQKNFYVYNLKSTSTFETSISALKRTRGTLDNNTRQGKEHTGGDNSKETTTTPRVRLRTLKSTREASVTDITMTQIEEPHASSSIKSTKRVSKLVQMFEKKFES